METGRWEDKGHWTRGNEDMKNIWKEYPHTIRKWLANSLTPHKEFMAYTRRVSITT